MRKAFLKDFQKGWIAGVFTPNLVYCKELEVGIKNYNKGDTEPRHTHDIAIEFTVVVDGIISMNGRQFYEGEISIVEPGEYVSFEAITDCTTVILKSPSLPGDKYFE